MSTSSSKKSNNPIAVAHSKRGGAGAGPHNNKTLSVRKGSSRKVKHKKKGEIP
jgi:hypothetical protein